MGCCWWALQFHCWLIYMILPFSLFELFQLKTLLNYFVAGDTHPLGCAFDESIVHHKVNFLFKIYLNWGHLKCDYNQSSYTKFICFCSISRKIRTTTMLPLTVSMGFTQKDVDWTMSWYLGVMMTTCTWYVFRSIWFSNITISMTLILLTGMFKSAGG